MENCAGGKTEASERADGRGALVDPSARRGAEHCAETGDKRPFVWHALSGALTWCAVGMTLSSKSSENVETVLVRLAQAARDAVGARNCTVSASLGGEREIVKSAGTDAESGLAAGAMLKALELGRDREAPGEDLFAVRLSPGELTAICAGTIRAFQEVRAAAWARGAEKCVAMVAIVADAERSDGELDAVASLACDGALALAVAAQREASREFWRMRATETIGKSLRAHSESEEIVRDFESLERILARGANRSPGERYALFGAALAEAGPFDGWIVAIAAGKGLKPVASSQPGEIIALDEKSALARSYAEQSVLARPGFASGARACVEDRIFGRPYICVPFENGAIALASRTPTSERLRARAQAMVRRLQPALKSWWLEDELARERELVRKLGLRMFAAIDEERARIARDLHDDQAQLLSAAQIALSGGHEQARGIFKRLETELRRRVRELRPARLGERGLEEALRAEMARLGEAGIKARLRSSRRTVEEPLSRPVQELCYQVAREALANVLRHSGATNVEIAIERRNGAARISVLDNGRGITLDPARGGMGLQGLRERIELMGGRLTIDSRPGATRLVADIPEPV